jgi:hypothetical protein
MSVSPTKKARSHRILPSDTRSAAMLMKLEDTDQVLKNIQRHHSKHWRYFKNANSSIFKSAFSLQ